MAKEEIKIKPFWYSDIWLFPKLITVITTLDKEGRVNAAPYSHIMQYDVMAKTPQMIVGFRQESHTFCNIVETGEFVINCPPFDYVDDMMETARFWPEGVNELDHTRFTPIPSLYVKPPSLKECPQIAECTVAEIIRLPKSSGIVIADIKAIVMEEGLKDMDRAERIQAMDLPVGLGDQNRRYYYHAKTTTDVIMHELQEPPGGQKGGDVKMAIPWDSAAQKGLMAVPTTMRQMVCTSVEDFAKAKGDTEVTAKRFIQMSEEYGIDSELMERFRTGTD
jgi:flavin reductase (DIM6/NTAB) family NADH-FMN oxidoreductase RutF